MPYVKGSGWDAATEQLAEGFATGTRVGLAKQELAQRKAWQEQQAKVQQASEQIQLEQLARQKLAEERQAKESEARVANLKLEDSVAQAKLDAIKNAEAQNYGLSVADLDWHKQTSQQLASQFPEMAPKIGVLWDVANRIDGPEARAKWLTDNAPEIVKEAQAIAVQKTAQKAMADLKEGHFAPGGQPDDELAAEYQNIVDALGMGQITPADAQKGLRDIKVKAAKLNGKRVKLQSGKDALTQEFLGKFQPGSDELESATAIIDLYYDEEMTLMQARDTLTKLSQPKESGGPEERLKARLSFYGDFMKPDPVTGEKPSLQEFEAAWSAISGEKPAAAPSGGSGGQQGAEARMAELLASGVPRKQALAKVQQEFGGGQLQEANPEMKAPTSTDTKGLTKPIDTMDKGGLDAFKRNVEGLEAKRKGSGKGSDDTDAKAKIAEYHDTHDAFGAKKPSEKAAQAKRDAYKAEVDGIARKYADRMSIAEKEAFAKAQRLGRDALVEFEAKLRAKYGK